MSLVLGPVLMDEDKTQKIKLYRNYDSWKRMIKPELGLVVECSILLAKLSFELYQSKQHSEEMIKQVTFIN
jgi:hypothetical protein